MQNYKNLVGNAISEAIDGALSEDDILSKIEVPKSLDLGDYAFPAFVLAKVLKKAPQIIATDLVAKINKDFFEKIEAVGPYVNFFLDKKEYSKDLLETISKEEQNFGTQDIGHGGNVTIDMSSPNIAKPMSMGHLRSTVIGNSIANILSKTGYVPIKINHLGDWGTQFGKLMRAYELWGSEAEVKKDPINSLLGYYVRFHQEDVKNPELDEQAREWFKRLEDGDKEATYLWKWFRSESLKAFMQVYDELNISFDSYNGEAFYNDKMQKVIDILKKKNLLKESQGAQVVDLTKYGLNPALIKKKDGATLYITRDLAAAIYRKNEYNFVQSLYVVGNEQSNHFEQLKAVIDNMGYGWAKDIHHIPFGLITKNGKKLSTRSGRVVLLEEVLEDAINLAKRQIEEKNPNLKDKEKIAKQVGVGAVVFHDLKNDRLNNFDFDLEEVVRFEGETGPYVQYSHARAMSILRKAGNKELKGNFSLDDSKAWETLRLMGDFPQVIKRALEEYEPSVIAKYSLHLAKAFNKYYAHTRILNEDQNLNSRLALVAGVALILKESLRLLGIFAPNEM